MRALTLILAVVTSVIACRSERTPPPETPVSESTTAAAPDSPPADLYTHLLRLARSRTDSDQTQLQKMLLDQQVLAQLDSDSAYEGRAERLRVAGVMQALATNDFRAARQGLVALSADQMFTSIRPRVVLLIQALANVRPPTPEVLAFWDRHCQPEDGFSNITIQSVFNNGTPEALALFEKNMLDARHENDRRSWLRFEVLTRRNDLPVLASSERLLSNTRLEEYFRLMLVDVLFDYRPDEWYGPHLIPKPPARSDASTPALQKLQQIATLSLTLQGLSQHQRDTITRVSEEVTALLKKR